MVLSLASLFRLLHGTAYGVVHVHSCGKIHGVTGAKNANLGFTVGKKKRFFKRLQNRENPTMKKSKVRFNGAREKGCMAFVEGDDRGPLVEEDLRKECGVTSRGGPGRWDKS